MKSRIAVSVLSLSVAVLSLMLGGCSGGDNNTESNFSDNMVQSAEDRSSSLTSRSVPLLPADSTPSTPSGEPMFLIGLDGKPTYTSELSRIQTAENGETRDIAL